MKLRADFEGVVVSGWRLPRARFPRLKESVLALTQGKLDGGSRLLSFELGDPSSPAQL